MTDYRAIWDYEAQPKERMLRCPLCDRTRNHFEWRASEDRYGFAQRSVQCRLCGLNFLTPRMTREAYARFYETAYRPLVSAFHGREINAQTIQPEQAGYAENLAKVLAPYVVEDMHTLLDIGGSTGVVAKILGGRLLLEPTVLDPSPDEIAECHVPDVLPIRGCIETFDPAPLTYDLITLCQTADHLLDLMGSLKKIRGLLTKDGLFWSDIVDFEVTREVKIDHPFNLTEATYRKFLIATGFNLLQINYAPDGKHIGFLCK